MLWLPHLYIKTHHPCTHIHLKKNINPSFIHVIELSVLHAYRLLGLRWGWLQRSGINGEYLRTSYTIRSSSSLHLDGTEFAQSKIRCHLGMVQTEFNVFMSAIFFITQQCFQIVIKKQCFQTFDDLRAFILGGKKKEEEKARWILPHLGWSSLILMDQ